jgi:hypothetical protein
MTECDYLLSPKQVAQRPAQDRGSCLEAGSLVQGQQQTQKERKGTVRAVDTLRREGCSGLGSRWGAGEAGARV